MINISSESLQKQIAEAEQRAESSFVSQASVLVEVRNRLSENKELIMSGNTMAERMARRLKWITKLGLELKNLIWKVWMGNVAIYNEVAAIRRNLSPRVSRSLDEEPFILEDAIGRVAPVHLRFITSWDAFDAVLDIRFKDKVGHDKVRQREYTLQEHATGREIDRTIAWDDAFLPGQRIDMSLIFKQQSPEKESNNSSSCPRCHAVSEMPAGSEVQWYVSASYHNF